MSSAAWIVGYLCATHPTWEIDRSQVPRRWRSEFHDGAITGLYDRRDHWWHGRWPLEGLPYGRLEGLERFLSRC